MAHPNPAVAIANYAAAKRDWLQTFLRLPHGIPSHDTFRRVFCLLDPAAFQECFQRWIDALSEGLGLKRVAIDGKALRRSFDRATGRAALHLVSAWATEAVAGGEPAAAGGYGLPHQQQRQQRHRQRHRQQRHQGQYCRQRRRRHGGHLAAGPFRTPTPYKRF
jgi:hypothetical protein